VIRRKPGRCWAAAEARTVACLAVTAACSRSTGSLPCCDRLLGWSLAVVPGRVESSWPTLSSGLCAVKNASAHSTECVQPRRRPVSPGTVGAALAVGATALFLRNLSRRWKRQRRAAVSLGESQSVDMPEKGVRWLSLLLVVIYVCTDVSVYLVGDRASQGYTKETVIICSASTSLIIGSVIEYCKRGMRGLQQCFDARNVLRLLPVSACFAASSLGLLLAFPHFDGAFIKLLGQAKLPLTALLSAAVLSRRYSLVQWQIILLIGVACTTFTALKLGSRIQLGGEVSLVGFAAVFAWVFFNVLATLFAERAFKKTEGLPFTTVMTNLRIGEIFAMWMMLLWNVPDFRVGNFFRGWDASTLAVLATFLGDAWLSALMVKNLSSVSKTVAKSCTLVVLYSLSLATGKQTFVLPQALAALIIFQATTLFASASWEQRERTA